VNAGPVANTGPPAGQAILEFSWTVDASQLNPGRNLGAVPPAIAPGRLNYYRQLLQPSVAAIAAIRDGLLIVALDSTYEDRPLLGPGPGFGTAQPVG
jgi:hypothetical protein